MYFCIVKHFKKNFSIRILIILTLSVCFSTLVYAQVPATEPASDSVEVSLLTCQPHNEVYSLYGHTAIRYHDKRTGDDWAFNYGIFSFKKPYFVLRFLFGKTDYELGVVPFDVFKREYARWGSMVTEQVINLTADEKQKIWKALCDNAQPWNRTYRYNFLYNNCTTKARDMIASAINGKIIYEERPDGYPSFRQTIHSCNKNFPWAAVGNDLCLGVKADLPTTIGEHQFLPANTMNDFAYAKIYANGNYRNLVKETRMAVPPGVQVIEPEFPLTPTECATVLLIIGILIFLYEKKSRKILRWWDVTLMLADGMAGIVILALFFSEHPTTSTNLQIFLFNPIPLIYIYSVWKGRKIYWKISLAMLFCFFIGNIWQDYAEGTEILALTLLIRCLSNMTIKKK